MISGKCLIAYGKQYPDDDCGYNEPSSKTIVSIENENGDCVIEPDQGETNEIFMDRLERSKKVGRNLFFEEWESFECSDNHVY